MNYIKLTLTKWHIRFSRNGKFERLERITVTDKLSVEVAIYMNPNDAFIGQATPWGTIIVNKLANTSDEVLKYVVSHEYGHIKQWYSLLAYIVVIAAWFFGGFTFVGGLFFLLFSWTSSIDLLTAFSMIALGTIFFLVGCGFSWFIEYKADSFAIKLLGMNQFIRARQVMTTFPKPPFLSWVLGRMTHPPSSIVLWTFQFFNRSYKPD